jgi:hypothetical protein
MPSRDHLLTLQKLLAGVVVSVAMVALMLYLFGPKQLKPSIDDQPVKFEVAQPVGITVVQAIGAVKQSNVVKESKLTELEARTIAEKYMGDQKPAVKWETPSVRYGKDDKTWRVTFHYIPARPGGFVTVVVDDLTAKVLRVEGGE